MRRFERIPGRAAEALDGTVYAIAARQAIGPVDFEERARRLTGEAFTATGCSGSPRGAFNLHGVRS